MAEHSYCEKHGVNLVQNGHCALCERGVDDDAEKFAENVRAIDTTLTRALDENRRMRALLAQAALFIACQPENRFRTRWLAETEELIHG